MNKPTTLDDIGEQLAHIVTAIGELPTKDDYERLESRMATKEDVGGLRAELKAEIAGIRAEMATKDDIAGLRSDIRDIRAELKEIRRELENVKGFGKEIDHALERIHAIEKHLGIEYKIAA